MSLADGYLDWKNLCVNKILFNVVYSKKQYVAYGEIGHFLCSVISQGKVVALDRWGGKWNHLSMPHRLTTNYAKNDCNRTRIVKVIVENVVTCFFETRCRSSSSFDPHFWHFLCFVLRWSPRYSFNLWVCVRVCGPTRSSICHCRDPNSTKPHEVVAWRLRWFHLGTRKWRAWTHLYRLPV